MTDRSIASNNEEDGDGNFVRGGFGRVSSKRNGNAATETYNLVEECTVPSPTMQRSGRNKRQSRCRLRSSSASNDNRLFSLWIRKLKGD